MSIKDNEITLTLGEGKDARRYRIRGLSKNLAVDVPNSTTCRCTTSTPNVTP